MPTQKYVVNEERPKSAPQRFSLKERRSQELLRQRRMRLADKAWRLGPRAFFEYIDGIDREFGIGNYLDRRLEKFADADPELVAAFGGDRFPHSPIRRVPPQ
jgi:hypothetical protein